MAITAVADGPVNFFNNLEKKKHRLIKCCCLVIQKSIKNKKYLI
jgi:hypothetical protein